MYQKTTVSSPKRDKAGRKFRLEQSQVTAPIIFAQTPRVSAKRFQDTFSCLYGPTKIGKSTLASLIPGTYLLATEPGYEWLNVRVTDVPNWKTFKKFVEYMENHPKDVASVKMWVVDTVDNLSQMCIEGICFDWGLTDISDEGWGRAWQELRQEFTFWILRLKALGPGVLFISHERQREFSSRKIKLNKDSMDLPGTTYSVVSYLCDVILHMRYVKQSHKAEEIGELRCLSMRPSETEDAGDKTKRLPSIIKFETEQQAVDKILQCFRKKGE